MPFNSLAYLILLALAVAATRLSPRPAWFLVIASLAFYMVAGIGDLAIFLTTVGLNWAIQVSIKRPAYRLLAATLVNIGLIASFKYRSLILSGTPGAAGSYVDTALPLGISFYCFQALAYHIDVVRGLGSPARDFKSFFLFKAFFPQLVAGPIVRLHQLLPQTTRLFDGRGPRYQLVSFGMALCLLGLVKKVVFADSLGPVADDAFSTVPVTTIDAWLGAAAFTFQIYFDFSGYSDIAIGSAYLLGIRLPRNFRTPYLSVGPRDFWQRWHISLSTWIRDYLYIPLGGSRGGAIRTATVLVATMAIAGLWHGANLTFVVWGAAWGVYILLARWFALPQALWRWTWCLHMLVVIMLWVVFRSPSLQFAQAYLQAMAGLPPPAASLVIGETTGVPLAWLAAAGFGGLFLLHWLESRLEGRRLLALLKRTNGTTGISAMAGLCTLLVLIPAANVNPFIYFRF